MASKGRPVLISKNDDDFSINRITPITCNSFLIGRGVECTLKLRQKSVSRKQCLIEKSGVNWEIKLLGSRTNLNGNPLFLNSPKLLKCSDVIEFPGDVKFEFKYCSPDQEGCSCESSESLASIICLNDNDSFILPSSPFVISQNSLSTDEPPSYDSFHPFKELQPSDSDGLSNKNRPSSLGTTGVESLNLRSPLEIDDFTEIVRNYANHLEKNDSIESLNHNHSSLTDALNLRLECAKLIEDYGIDESCLGHERNGNINSLIEVVKRLSSALDKKRNDITLIPESVFDLRKALLVFDVILTNKLKDVIDVLNKLPNSSKSEQSNPHLSTDISSTVLHICSCKQRTKRVVNRKRREFSVTSEDLEDDISALKEKVKSQIARIEFFKMKLSERENSVNELELCKEENDKLRKTISEMKRTIAEKDLMELEFKYLQESVKYKEEDKRSKDVLQERITSMQNENSKLTADLEQMKTESAELVEKNKKLEDMLSTKTTDSGENGEFDNDAARNFSKVMLELLEREFNCSICGEILVEPTVTNCSHVFCTHCLAEWKKMKKECPFCRSHIVRECKPAFFDEYINSFLRLCSEKMLAERLRVVEERKAPPVEPPSAKRPRVRARRTVTPRAARNARAQQNRANNPPPYALDPISGYPHNFIDGMALAALVSPWIP